MEKNYIEITRDISANLKALIGRGSGEAFQLAFDGRGYVRLSAHAYNAPADYRRLAADLPGLL